MHWKWWEISLFYPKIFVVIFNSFLSITDAENCVFPSLYKNKPIFDCQLNSNGHWWCPLDENYDSYRTWQLCPSTKKTFAGNDPGKPCKFPFIFDSNPVYTCLKANDSKFWWCATTDNYDIDRKWTKCRPDSDELPCYFSNYGQVHVAKIDSQCHSFSGDLICKTETNEIRKCPFTSSTYGGNDPGKMCHFPFYYKQMEYKGCVRSQFTDDQLDEGALWCSTTINFETHKKWTLCQRGVLDFISVPSILLIGFGISCLIPLAYTIRYIRVKLSAYSNLRSIVR